MFGLGSSMQVQVSTTNLSMKGLRDCPEFAMYIAFPLLQVRTKP